MSARFTSTLKLPSIFISATKLVMPTALVSIIVAWLRLETPGVYFNTRTISASSLLLKPDTTNLLKIISTRAEKGLKLSLIFSNRHLIKSPLFLPFKWTSANLTIITFCIILYLCIHSRTQPKPLPYCAHFLRWFLRQNLFLPLQARIFD